MTTGLDSAGLSVIAVEPLAEMRAALKRRLPEVPAAGGSAEALPFAPMSVDAIVVASAMHRFSTAEVVAELARVTSRLAVAWNVRDETVDWVRTYSELVNRRRGDLPCYKSMVRRELLDRTADATDERWFDNPMTMTAETLVARAAST